MRRLRLGLLISLAIAVTAAVAMSALGASLIPLTSLEIRTSEFSGFAGSRPVITVETNIHKWSEHFHKTHTEELTEEAELKKYGFQEGVGESFEAGMDEAEYEVEVFGSYRGAAHEVSIWTSEAVVRRRHNPGYQLSHIPGISGSVFISELIPAFKEGSSNVVFAVGRCWFHISDVLGRVSNRKGVDHATTALAEELDRSMRHNCA